MLRALLLTAFFLPFTAGADVSRLICKSSEDFPVSFEALTGVMTAQTHKPSLLRMISFAQFVTTFVIIESGAHLAYSNSPEPCGSQSSPIATQRYQNLVLVSKSALLSSTDSFEERSSWLMKEALRVMLTYLLPNEAQSLEFLEKETFDILQGTAGSHSPSVRAFYNLDQVDQNLNGVLNQDPLALIDQPDRVQCVKEGFVAQAWCERVRQFEMNRSDENREALMRLTLQNPWNLGGQATSPSFRALVNTMKAAQAEERSWPLTELPLFTTQRMSYDDFIRLLKNSTGSDSTPSHN